MGRARNWLNPLQLGFAFEAEPAADAWPPLSIPQKIWSLLPPIDYHRRTFPMNRNASESAVDRLIAMAEDEKTDAPKPPAALPDGGRELGSMPLLADPARGLDDNPMLKALLQFRMLAPYMGRLMEPDGQNASLASLSAELKQNVGDLQLAQRDLRMTVQDQLVQMKRVEEEMHRTREATERNAFESSELVEDMKSVHSLVKRTGAVLGAMLAVLIGLVIYAIAKNPHLLP